VILIWFGTQNLERHWVILNYLTGQTNWLNANGANQNQPSKAPLLVNLGKERSKIKPS
jgi:hypothetical protein